MDTSIPFLNGVTDEVVDDGQEGWETIILLCALGIMISYADFWSRSDGMGVGSLVKHMELLGAWLFLRIKEKHVASTPKKRIGLRLKPVRRSNDRNLLRKSIMAGKQPQVHTTRVYQVLRCPSCRLPILPHHWYTFP